MVRFFLGLALGILLTTETFVHLSRYQTPPTISKVADTDSSDTDTPADTSPSNDENPVVTGTLLNTHVGKGTMRLRDLEPDNSGEFTIQSHRGPDGYSVDQATFDHSTVVLRVFKYRDEKSFRAAIRATGENDDTEGLSYFSQDTNECVMLIRDPAFRYQPTTMGHELTHCIYGDFHKDDYPE